MNRRRFRRVRLPALIASLALFLAGSNYCMLSAWAGNSKMACMVAPATTTKARTCGHCAPVKSNGGKTTASRSCCPAPLVAPSAPSVEKASAFPGPSVAAFIAAVIDLSPLHPSAWLGRLALPDGQPPTRLVSAPLAARAPPLA
jgi:hypothetical protein